MKNEKQLIIWIREMYDKYKAILFIEKYNLVIEKEKEDIYLGSKFNYPYLEMTITYSLKFLTHWQKNKKEAERRIIHEFCHTVTDPFYAIVLSWPTKTAIEESRERLTDHIAQIINKHFTNLSK